MSIEAFNNGFLLGLALAYKKMAAAGVLPGIIWLTLAETVVLSVYDLPVEDSVQVLQPEDLRPAGLAENVSLAPMPVTDNVTIILT